MSENFKLDIKFRPRRMRRTAQMRALCEETSINLSKLIAPLFVSDGKNENIDSMPEIKRLNIDSLLKKCETLLKLGINSVAIFPSIEANLRTKDASEALNKDTLALRAIRAIKKRFPKMLVVADIALDPYTSHGHDGILDTKKNCILNDETVDMLCAMSLLAAEAGADFIAPSDMMDGRVSAIREALDNFDFTDTAIMAYSAKYASAFYGPFRDALKTNKNKPIDKKTYQLNFSNSREALLEAGLDEFEGADILMVKPASHYLDIISKIKERTYLPVAAYQVSGEYSMIMAAAQKGWIDLDKCVVESLSCIRRAGADIILTYFAEHYAKLMQKK